MTATKQSDDYIETHLVEEILDNLFTEKDDGKYQVILLDLLAIPSNQSLRKEKRNFKTLPSSDQISKLDAKLHCIARLLTFEYLQKLFLFATQQEAEKESLELILTALMDCAPVILIKRIMKHNYLLHSNSTISWTCLNVMHLFVEKRLFLYDPNDKNDDIPNNELNGFIHDWVQLDVFECVLTMLSLYSCPPQKQYTTHCHVMTQLMRNVLLFCPDKALNVMTRHKTGHFYIQNRTLCVKQGQPQEMKCDFSSKDIDLCSLHQLYLEGNASLEQCNILIVGDGDFTFSRGLMELWPHILSSNNNKNNTKLNLITSTFHSLPSLIEKYYHRDIADIIYKIQRNARVLYAVDATDLSCFCGAAFDRIIFNFPQMETSVGDHRLKSLNQNLIFEFLQSSQTILAANGQIFIALHINEFKASAIRNRRKDDEKFAPKYVQIKPMQQCFDNKEEIMSVSHDQFFTWRIPDVLKRPQLKCLKYTKSMPFHAHWYPGYNVTNVKGQRFDFCKAKIHIFKHLIK